MGSIVSSIHDIEVEYGTWENYILMEDKKKRLQSVMEQMVQLSEESRECNAAYTRGNHRQVHNQAETLYNMIIAGLAKRAIEIQKEIENGHASNSAKRNPSATEHELKCIPEYFQDIVSRKKQFEFRRNDRNFKVGDVLILREYILPTISYPGGYTGASFEAIVNYLLPCSTFEPESNFVVLGISPVLL